MNNIGQRVSLQHLQECRQGLAEHRLQSAGWRDAAGIPGGKTFHNAEILFGFPDQDANVNVPRCHLQAHPTFLATNGFDVALFC